MGSVIVSVAGKNAIKCPASWTVLDASIVCRDDFYLDGGWVEASGVRLADQLRLSDAFQQYGQLTFVGFKEIPEAGKFVK